MISSLLHHQFFSLFWSLKIRIQSSVISLILKIKICIPLLSPSTPFFSFLFFSIFQTIKLLKQLYLIPHLLSFHEPRPSDFCAHFFSKLFLLSSPMTSMFPNLVITSQSYLYLTYKQHSTVDQSCLLKTLSFLGSQDIFLVFLLPQGLCLFILLWWFYLILQSLNIGVPEPLLFSIYTQS